jgi:hypothetical protein
MNSEEYIAVDSAEFNSYRLILKKRWTWMSGNEIFFHEYRQAFKCSYSVPCRLASSQKEVDLDIKKWE